MHRVHPRSSDHPWSSDRISSRERSLGWRRPEQGGSARGSTTRTWSTEGVRGGLVGYATLGSCGSRRRTGSSTRPATSDRYCPGDRTPRPRRGQDHHVATTCARRIVAPLERGTDDAGRGRGAIGRSRHGLHDRALRSHQRRKTGACADPRLSLAASLAFRSRTRSTPNSARKASTSERGSLRRPTSWLGSGIDRAAAGRLARRLVAPLVGVGVALDSACRGPRARPGTRACRPR